MKQQIQKDKDLLIYIFNIIEDEWSFISAIEDPIRRFECLTQSEDAAEAYFLSLAGEKDFVYISPKPISQTFQDYAQSIFNFEQAKILTPSLRSHLICEDLISDTRTFNTLITLAKQYRKITLISYVASFEFYSLKEQLVRSGLIVETPEAPKYENAWTVNFFGSKSGIRQLSLKSHIEEPDFIMPNGIICTGKQDAAKIAANRYLKQKGVVIKTNKGSGGDGVLIFSEGELPTNYRECIKKILEQMPERYWDVYPIIIEDLINVNFNSATCFPNIEFKIYKNKRIEMLYVCTSTVTPKGKYYGLDINESILNDRLQTRIEDTGYYIAEQFALAGYKGHFDIDMILAKNGDVYVCEANTRNTGGTDTYKIAKYLIGKNFMNDTYTISRSGHHWFLPHQYTFEEILEKTKALKYSKKTKEGIILNTENSIIDGTLIYTIIAKTKKRTYELENQLKASLLY